MRRILTVIAVLFISSLPVCHSFAAISPAAELTHTPPESVFSRIASLKVKDLQKALGRKLTVKERVGFFFLKKQMKKKAGEESKQGQSSFILGLASVGLLAVGLLLWPPLIIGAVITSILAIVFGTMATKENPKDKKAIAGKIMGWITLGLIVVLTILVLAAFASVFN